MADERRGVRTVCALLEEEQTLNETDEQTLQDCGFGFDELLVRNQSDRMILDINEKKARDQPVLTQPD